MTCLRHLWQWFRWRQNRQQRLHTLREIRRSKHPQYRRCDWLIYCIVRLLEQRPRKFQPI